jgi:TRAP-type C4-dicarboxylate transport system substrate-binding protein
MRRWIVLTLIAVMVVALLVGGCSSAKPAPAPSPTPSPTPAPTPAPEKPIELSYECNVSPPHPYALAAEAAIAHLEEATNGRVHITAHWGGTILSRQEPRGELGAGVVDMAHAPYESPVGGEILYYLDNLGLLVDSSDPKVAMDIGMEIYRTFPEVKEELHKQNVELLGMGNTEPRMFVSRTPVRTLADLKGKLIRAKGYEDLFSMFNASTADIPAPDVYVALEKGTVDASFLPFETLKSLRFAEVAKYVTLDLYAPWLGTPMTLMNLDSYNKLPADIQQIFTDNIEYWNEQTLKYFKENTLAAEDFAKENNVEYINLSAADKAAWHSACVDVCDIYIKYIDEAGSPGTEIAEAIMKLGEEMK